MGLFSRSFFLLDVRWLGNSCLEVIEEPGREILIDPCYEVEPKVNPDLVLVTHEHDDHFNKKQFESLNGEKKLFALRETLEKFEVDGTAVSENDAINDIRVMFSDCYNAEKSVSYFINELLHPRDSAKFPRPKKEVKLAFPACFPDLYSTYTDELKEVNPNLVIPFYYDLEEVLEEAKELSNKLKQENLNSKVIDLGDKVEL
ncbi:MAG: Zn-dependent hydrolase of the beta-lactamase fold [Candidatus Methanohalarchaeum thermophilum]|uniref:Zn-dependent hydrolase of the beta-lactamase fold n=1 Tax=Methanohalarchaeum thermophilum TaxID=1903181 RepID=A0A1Q6DV89_METT1|nr:MAG: Zn-dependent hydrolase of the beta-lactamase fold [Candidatus Methanohalarchaeum thermophilum]